MLKLGNENQFQGSRRKKSAEEVNDTHPNVTMLCTGWGGGVIMVEVYMTRWFKKFVNVPISLIQKHYFKVALFDVSP